MGYCPFSNLGHDTTDCIVTHGSAGERSRRCDTAPKRPAIRPARGHDTVGLHEGRVAARTRTAWPLGVLRYNGRRAAFVL